MAKNTREEPLSKVASKNLKKQLALAGYTQEQFAEKIGVDVRTIRRWIRAFPGLDQLQECIKVLKIPVTEFFDTTS